MRSLSKALLAIGFGALVVLGPTQSARAAEVDSADLIIITEGSVVDDDLYVIASRVLVRGQVDGDLIAVAGQDIRIEGEVTGSVMALGSEVVVTGTVGGSLRASAASVTLTGHVDKDLFVTAQGADFSSDSFVGGDVILWAWSASILGSVGGDLTGNIRNLDLAGEVVGDVSVSVNRLEVVGALVVEGDLNYRSDRAMVGQSDAAVDGAIVQQRPLPANIRVRAVQLVGRILVAIVLSAVALLVASAWPEKTERGLNGLRKRPWASLGWGSAVMLSPFLLAALAAGLFAVTPPAASVPLIAIMAPVILAAFGLVLMVGVVAGVPAVAFIGNTLRRRTTVAGAVGIGSAIVGVVWLLPYVGALVAAATLMVGAGGWITGLRMPLEDDSGLLAAPMASVD